MITPQDALDIFGGSDFVDTKQVKKPLTKSQIARLVWEDLGGYLDMPYLYDMMKHHILHVESTTGLSDTLLDGIIAKGNSYLETIASDNSLIPALRLRFFSIVMRDISVQDL